MERIAPEPDRAPDGPVLAIRAVAWLGGLAFVVSLGWFVHTMAIRFRTTEASGRVTAQAVLADVLLFTVFALHHSLLASETAKRWLRRAVTPRLERPLYVWVASLLLIGVCVGWRRLPGVLYAHTGWAVAVHLGLVFAGFVLTIAGVRKLDALELAGIRPAMRREAESGEPLVTAWPYSMIRHPLYLGWMLIVFGMPVMTYDRLLMAVVSSTYLLLAIPWEERRLVAALGERYRQYQRRVRWRVVPGVY